MIVRHFSNQPSVCTTTSTQLRTIKMDSLTGTKPASEGSLQDSIESDYTGCSTDPIASSTNSHSGLSTGSNAAPSQRWAQKTTHTTQLSQHEQKTPLGKTQTAASTQLHCEPETQRLPSLAKTATSSNATSMPASPTACWEGLIATSHGKLLSSARAISASVGDPTGTVAHTTGSAVDSTDLIRAETNKVVSPPPNTTTHDWLQGTIG